MKVFKCVITGDEMFTDSYPISENFHDLIYEVKAKYVTEKVGDDIDDSKIGGNKSAEAPDEAATDEAATKSGVNVCLASRYEETFFSNKKEFIATMGAYFKEIIGQRKKKAEEDGTEFDEADFKAKHLQAMKETILPMFKDLKFYTGESVNPDGTIALLYWKECDGEERPHLYYFRCGLRCEKY